MASSWAQLPPEILQLLFERLPLPDCLTFGKVCPSWRSVYNESRRLTRPPPCMLLKPYPRDPSTGTLWGLHGAQLLKLSSPVLNLHQRERIVGSSMGWLVIIAYTPTVAISPSESVSFSPILHMLNPISNERIPLPGYSGAVYHVALSTDPRSHDCVLVMSGCIDDCSISFAWCRPADLKWNPMDVGFRLSTGSRTGKMTFHNGKLYVVGHKEEIHIFAFDPQPNKISTGSFASISESRDWFEKQMVQSGAELLLLGWSHPKNIDSVGRNGRVMLDVFQQAEESDRWVRVESLGDRVLLIGKNLNIEALVKFSVAERSSQMIHLPLTDQKHAYLADVGWIVPQEWTRAIHSGSLADDPNLPHISFGTLPPLDTVKVNFDAGIYKDGISEVICADLANVLSGGANENVAGEDSSSSGDGEGFIKFI